jgi:hypothetical protein
MRRIFAYTALVLAAALPAPAAGQVTASTAISGSSAKITVTLPGTLGAEATLSFENVSGLSLTNLGISAHVINPLDSALLARLPGGSTPAGGLPVLLRIEPPSTGSLAFTGLVELSVHTHSLAYTTGTPLRIFSAPLGGAFHDITTHVGEGSYRARSTTGGFSEFLIVSEARTVDQVIAAKFDRLEDLLEEYEGSMSTSLYDDLSALLAAAETEYGEDDLSHAIQEVNDFLDAVEDNSGTAIPNLWRSARDVENVAGYLRARAMTLRFSLAFKRSLGL